MKAYFSNYMSQIITDVLMWMAILLKRIIILIIDFEIDSR